MRIALTADVHLTTRSEHPGRFEALEDVLKGAKEEGAQVVVIAGDLFDAARRGYADFEAMCRDQRFANLRILVIPGNHDPDLSQGAIAAKNVEVITEPQLLSLQGQGPEVLLIPYEPQKTMGEQISPFKDRLTEKRWVLIGHGDWTEGVRAPNPYEPGVYMPLTRRDIEAYQPGKVLLGHVHLPLDREPVYYPGSPHPMDITETGPRRFLLLDTDTFEVIPRRVKANVIYFDERLVVMPVEDEGRYLQDQIERRIERWGLDAGDRAKVRVRVRVAGYSSDRKALAEILEQSYSTYRYYEDNPPDISGVSISSDPDRKYIAERARSWIGGLEWPGGPEEPSRDDILLAALQVIYGGK